jgi:hypothetical protein
MEVHRRLGRDGFSVDDDRLEMPAAHGAIDELGDGWREVALELVIGHVPVGGDLDIALGGEFYDRRRRMLRGRDVDCADRQRDGTCDPLQNHVCPLRQ